MTRGVLVGAYERDNFGDILFLHATRHWLGDRVSRATAPFSGDTTVVDGDLIDGYVPVLNGANVPFVWVVGGETGGTTLSQAASAADRDPASPGLPSFASPYMPRPSRYPASAGAKYVINSVGVAPAVGLSGRRRIETIGAIREASFLSVRDRGSAALLDRWDIPHHVAPDIVHTIRTSIGLPDGPSEPDVALVQFKERHIAAHGLEQVAQALVSSAGLRPFRIRLFSAGEAPGHDSTEVLHRLADEIRRIEGSDRVDVSTARTSLEKAAEIARCGLWVGTSLHGFIISTAYGVPRVALLLEKVARYARSWDVNQPSNVPLAEIDAAVATATAVSAAEHEDMAVRLASLAEDNVKVALSHLDDPLPVLTRAHENARIAVELDRMGPVPEFADRALRRWGRTSIGARLRTVAGRTRDGRG